MFFLTISLSHSPHTVSLTDGEKKTRKAKEHPSLLSEMTELSTQE